MAKEKWRNQTECIQPYANYSTWARITSGWCCWWLYLFWPYTCKS